MPPVEHLYIFSLNTVDLVVFIFIFQICPRWFNSILCPAFSAHLIMLHLVFRNLARNYIVMHFLSDSKSVLSKGVFSW